MHMIYQYTRLFFLFSFFLFICDGWSGVWTPEEMMRVKVIKGIEVSPTGKDVVFNVIEPLMDESHSQFVMNIYKGTTDGQKNATNITQDEYINRNPRWSPDGKSIAYISNRSGKQNIYVIPPNGGEAIQVTDCETAIQTLRWSPDSKSIAFVMSNPLTDEQKAQIKGKDDVIVVDEIVQRNHLWVVNIGSGIQTPTVLTDDRYFVLGMGDFNCYYEAFDWSPDGQFIAFTHTPGPGCDNIHLRNSVSIINLKNGCIEDIPQVADCVSYPHYSHNGKSIALVVSDTPATYGISRYVVIFSLKDRSIQRLAPTYNEGPMVGDIFLLGWTADDQYTLIHEPKGTRYHISALPINGAKPHDIDLGDALLKSASLNAAGDTLGFDIESPSLPPEAGVYFIHDSALKTVSSINAYLTDYHVGRTEVFQWRSADGQCIEGLLTYPTNYQKGKACPLLVIVHGGPMAFDDESFIGRMCIYPYAAFADEGFAILRPNFRGSCGYGRDFRYANYCDWGGMDFQDIKQGVTT